MIIFLFASLFLIPHPSLKGMKEREGGREGKFDNDVDDADEGLKKIENCENEVKRTEIG